MKRANIIQLSLLLLGVSIAILSIDLLVGFLVQLIYWVAGGGTGDGLDYMLTNTLTTSFVLVVRLLAAWLLITRSGVIADWVSDKAGAQAGFSLRSRPEDLLHVLLVVLGMYLFITAIPPLFNNLYFGFRSAGGGYKSIGDRVPGARDWLSAVTQLVTPLILLAYARPIAVYFSRKLGEDSVLLEHELDE